MCQILILQTSYVLRKVNVYVIGWKGGFRRLVGGIVVGVSMTYLTIPPLARWMVGSPPYLTWGV